MAARLGHQAFYRSEGGHSHEEDEEEADTDALMAGPSPALQVLSTGWVTFASHIDKICHHYEGSCTTCASPHTTNSPCTHSNTLLTSNPEANLCVYKFDIMTGMILTLHCFLSNYPTEGTAKYIQHALQLKSFK